MASQHYSDLLLEHSRHPRNVGSLATPAPGVGVGRVGSQETGAVVQLHLQCPIGTQRIEAMRFQAYGDTATIAAASLMTEWLHGKTLDEALQLTSSQLVQALQIPPARVFGAMLVQDAVRSAVADCRQHHRANH